ncbi:MAG: V-type ATP synthase subunit E [Anaerovoracaceae bacterium]
MDNMEKILVAIKKQGEAEAEKILQAGKKNADGIYKLYGEEAKVEEDAIMKRAEKEVAWIQQRNLSQAGIGGRNIKLKAKRQALEQSFDLAEEKLIRLPKEKKEELYKKLIVTYTNGSEAEIVFNKEDKQTIGKKLLEDLEKRDKLKLTLCEKPGDFKGGLIIKEGDVETSCTFEVLKADGKKVMESEIAEMLFS